MAQATGFQWTGELPVFKGGAGVASIQGEVGGVGTHGRGRGKGRER